MTTRWIFAEAQLKLREGDITRADADAVVNAANSGLLGGGGVDGAIHRAAGPRLLEACRDIVSRISALPPGQAVITPGFNLPARFIIHTVGPIWRDGGSGEAATLRSAYAACLNLAHTHRLSRVAFPAISCGAYGFPLDQAADIALDALRQGLMSGLVREASLWLHGRPAYDFWLGRAMALFGPPLSTTADG